MKLTELIDKLQVIAHEGKAKYKVNVSINSDVSNILNDINVDIIDSTDTIILDLSI